MTLLALKSAAAFLNTPRRSATSPTCPATVPARTLPRVGTFSAVLHALWVWIIDGSTYEEGEGYLCEDCRDVHWLRTGCPRRMYGWCQNCETDRVLTRAGNCSSCGSRSIVDRYFPHRDVSAPLTIVPDTPARPDTSPADSPTHTRPTLVRDSRAARRS